MVLKIFGWETYWEKIFWKTEKETRRYFTMDLRDVNCDGGRYMEAAKDRDLVSLLVVLKLRLLLTQI
jgi:hypothetical protein